LSKIFEALERSRREKRGAGKGPGERSRRGRASNSTAPDMEDEMVGLYQSIDSLLSRSPQKVIQFMGSRGGEGTSTIVCEFANKL
jgi:protein-tyrosine kinase